MASTIKVRWDFEDTDLEDMPYREALLESGLPEIVDVPDKIWEEAEEYEDHISDWLSDKYGFTHHGWVYQNPSYSGEEDGPVVIRVHDSASNTDAGLKVRIVEYAETPGYEGGTYTEVSGWDGSEVDSDFGNYTSAMTALRAAIAEYGFTHHGWVYQNPNNDLLYSYEYTDRYGGANYSWVDRGTVYAKDLQSAYVKARAAVGLTGIRGRKDDYGDEIHFKPYGSATVLFVSEETYGW